MRCYALVVRADVCVADLDFYGAIKLVNYLREAFKMHGKPPVEVGRLREENFADEKYLQPVLAEDALLFSLDEVLGLANRRRKSKEEDDNKSATVDGNADLNLDHMSSFDKSRKIMKLEERVAQLTRMEEDFKAYKEMVAHTIDTQWNSDNTIDPATSAISKPPSHTTATQPHTAPPPPAPYLPDPPDPYFDSYAHPFIHETMLKDRVRTNTYHRFIHGHKALFAHRTVLDVGCGTGILSFFAASAGAAKVHAVDNSSIILRAREIAATNNLSGTVRFHRGKIEELHRDVPELEDVSGKVDILVSEWMGYALLYEAMLDSVIAARDLYLRPPSSPSQPETAGLMVPSHCTIHLAPCADPEYIDDTQTYWRDVYGYDYAPMLSTPDFHTDAVVRDVPSRSLCAAPTLLKTFALQSVTTADLDFVAPFSFTITRDVESLDGFALWFDAFFLPPPSNVRKELPADVDGANWRGPGVAFTTGPLGKDLTHWQMVWLGIDRITEKVGGRDGRMRPKKLRKGAKVEGTVGYKKRTGGEGDEERARKRELEILLTWRVEEEGVVTEEGRQAWLMK